LMEQALERFSHQPVLGLGFDGAKFEIDGHALGTHNGLLDLLLRLGYAGTALFAVFSIVIVKIASALKPPFKAVSIMALIAIFSLSTNSSTFFVFNYLFLYVLILICAGKKARISVSQ
ncbi:O-antigen ligase family protein, partial [Acinetobacter baumannii]